MKKIVCVILAITALCLTACDNETIGEIPRETNPTSAETMIPEKMSETTKPVTTPPETEVTTTVPDTTAPEIIPAPKPEKVNWNIVEVSEGNEFIDFDFYKEISGIRDRSEVKDLADIAEKAVRENKTYISDMATLKGYFPGKLSDYERRHGEVKPTFRAAYTVDLDCDGRQENFVLLDTLSSLADDKEKFSSYLVFIDGENNAEVVRIFSGRYSKFMEVNLLDYGKFRQLYVNGFYDSAVIGLKGGKPVILYEFGGWIDKDGCFLVSDGRTDVRGDRIYFDTVAEEYRVIAGIPYDADKFFSQDKSTNNTIFNNLREYYENGGYIEVELFDGKYYCVSKYKKKDNTPYGYDEGTYFFVFDDDKYVFDSGIAMSGNSFNLNAVRNFSIEKALAEMKKPEKTSQTAEASSVSKFVDFDYLKDYSPITDRNKVKDLADIAEKALSQSDELKKEIEYSAKWFEERGGAKPTFEWAITEDFDGDGNDEAFVLVYPQTEYYMNIAYYLVFVDENNNAEIADSFYGVREINLFNYGKCKQLAIIGTAAVGAGMHSDILGVKDDKPVKLYDFRGDFDKYGCFLNASGWQGSGDFMYFDTDDMEYKAIMGESVDFLETLAMDKTNSLHELYSYYPEHGYYYVRLYGGKYYNFSMGPLDAIGTTYTYENGRFVPADYMGIRNSNAHVKTVNDVDIDKALAEMVKPS